MSKTAKAIGGISLALVGGAALSACAGSSSAPPSMSSGSIHAAAGKATETNGVSYSVGAASPLAISPHLQTDTVGEIVTTPQVLIVRTGAVKLGVNAKDIVNVFSDVSMDVGNLGGYVESSSSSSANDAGGASLVVRVPSARFGTLVTKVDSLGKVEGQSENGNDVTGQSIDLQAQLENLKSEEAALRALVAKATSVSSILEVQNQLFNVEGDIQQLTAQENSLIDQATYSTMSVDLSPLAAHVAAKAGPNTFAKATKTAAHNSSLAVKGIVYAVGWAFPGLVLAALVGFFGRWIWRRRNSGGDAVELLEGA